MNIIYTKYQYMRARAFLQDAEIIRSYSDPCVSNTTYSKGGRLYYEHNSKLEAPEDDYYVAELEAQP